MAFLAGNLKSLIAIKIKTRHDGYTDQVSRIVVAKVFLVASLVMGVDWFHDTVTCIPPPVDETSNLPDKYIESGCWIKGFYVFPDLGEQMTNTGYYGIPLNLRETGFLKNSDSGKKETCIMKPIFDPSGKYSKNCEPMEKYYFIQYQWMPFYVASMAALFYLPYIVFRVVNTDVISLRLNMRDDQVTSDDIVENYFNHDINSRFKMRMRILMNLFIKLLYLLVNVCAFLLFDSLLNSNFHAYGIDWVRWARQNSTMAYDFNARQEPTPGNRMLPSFGMCELVESRRDSKRVTMNLVVVVCEISSNILYQYVFLVLWFVLVCSITIACFGVVMYVGGHIHVSFFVKNEKSSKYVYKLLTFRECEYLEFIRRRDLAMYGAIVNKLRELNSLPLPKVRSNKKKGATAPMLPNGRNPTHHLRHLDSVELGI